MLIAFELNGRKVKVEIQDSTRLIDMLRDNFNLTGAKEGCGQGECGACTVIVDDMAVNSCLVLACQVEDCRVLTIEGLAEGDKMDSLQDAFISEGAIQCGYCTPGMILAAKAFLLKNPKPNIDEIKEAMAGNLCRCTGYSKIIKAISKVALGGE